MGKHITLTFVALLALMGCGGGGGGGVSGSSPVTTTKTYNNAKSNTVDATFNSNNAVSGMSSPTVSETTIAVTTNSSDEVIKLVLTNNSGTTTFSTASGDTIDALTYYGSTVYHAYNASQSKQSIILADTTNNVGIGHWYEKSGNTGYATAFHSGTEPTGVDPSTLVSSATYDGLLTGILSETGYSPIYTFADIVGTANFTSKRITLSSSGTEGYRMSDGADLGSYSGQDFTVTLNDGNSDNNYEGSATDSEGKTGNVSATLYGDNAKVLAGVGTLANGNDTRTHVFAFGAER